jgi:hypothetical protein
VRSASLPGRAVQDRGDGVHEARVGVGDHHLHALQSASAQAAQKRQLPSAILVSHDVRAENLPQPIGGGLFEERRRQKRSGVPPFRRPR